MKRLLTGLWISVFFGLTFSSASWAEEPIGQVILVKGSPIVIRGEDQLILKRKDSLYQQDKLITKEGSRLRIKLKDNTSVSLAENTEFDLTRYQYSAEKSDVSFKLIKGAFRTVTGLIGQQKSPKLEVHTPIATIGVRGTDFWGGFLFSDALDVTMIKGKGVYVKNDSGVVELTKPTDGTTVLPSGELGSVKQWSDEKLATAAAATSVD